MKSAEVALPNSASVLDSVAMDAGVEGTLESTSHTADKLKQSLYGAIAAEVHQFPVVLSLTDLTGHHASADKILEAAVQALQTMELEDGCNFIALTTDNPTVMQAFRRKFQDKYYWIIQNCETCWYVLILQTLSVNEHCNALTLVCLCPDAQHQTGGFTPVASDVVTTVLCDAEFWNAIEQLIWTAKPLVDTIGDCELCDTSLSNCMLALIHCARTMFSLSLKDGDHAGFWAHACSVFNCHFHAMDTNIHSLTLFLHPLCQKLAISQVANGHSFQFMVEAALKITKQWRWSEALALSVVHNLKEYYKCSGVFVGGKADALGCAEKYPLKIMAITIHSIVPHAADVEHYFSDLGVKTFQMLSKAHAHYSYHLWKMDCTGGKLTHWKHAHMHTQPTAGIDMELAADLDRMFSWVPPLVADSSDPDDHLAGPELIMDEELVQTFEELEHKSAEALRTVNIDQPEDGSLPTRILDGDLYAWDELNQVDKGLVPRGFREGVTALETASLEGASWDVSLLMLSEGL
ncbi:hypothetical protein J3A83DRAFT_4356503 [Scleroderma citrinum]